MKFPGLTDVSLALAVLIRSSAPVIGAAPSEPEPETTDLPRVPAVSPEHALETFQIKGGFQLRLAASEPLIMSPVALSFDERGRLFVVEMRDYSERRDEHLGRIRLLQDTDGDGRFDKSTTFADNLAWPTAVLCADGGIFVGATPDILYFKDTDGDGVADVRDVAFTGFGKGNARLNVQQLLNSFAWGLDNRIHGANGGNGGSITSPKHPNDPAVELRGRDFSFDPRTMTIRAESGGGQHGMSFDDWGRKFVCSNSSHIREVMVEERYAGRNPFLAMPPPALDIAVDGAAAEVYRISPEEPWRVLRTKWRVAGLVPGPVEGGGRASGYFTSATGLTIYRGDAFPDSMQGDAFVADCGSNLVHHKKLLPDGVALKAERPADEQKSEFLASRDLWFRPVQMANGPDGSLYLIDMYREVIEHPWSFPQSIKKHLDLNSGSDRGRIYRIVPDSFSQRAPVRLESKSTAELVDLLAHPNGWHRDTAARLLYERQDRDALPNLKRLLAESKSPLGRLHALYALDGLALLTDAELVSALDDQSPWVRKHAIRLLEILLGNKAPPTAASQKLARLADDPDPQVRYQLAFSLGGFVHPDRIRLLTQLTQTGGSDPWMRIAILNAIGDGAIDLFSSLTSERNLAEPSQPFLNQLATLIGARNRSSEINRVVRTLAKMTSPPLPCALGNALGAGLRRVGRSLDGTVDAALLEELLEKGRGLVTSADASPTVRLDAVRLLGQGKFLQVRAALGNALAPGQPVEVQRTALHALAGFAMPEVADDLLQAFDSLTPSLRGEAIESLLRRPERIAALLAALESGKLRRADLSTGQVDFLRKRPEEAIRQRVDRLLGSAPVGARSDVVKAFGSSLGLEGNLEHGRTLFLERCASCHRLAGQGYALGPDLETVRSSGKETLLGNILDPNREVMPKYVNYLAETKDGESVTGLIAVESDSNVVLRQAYGNETTLQRSNLQKFRNLGQSVMPEGLEEGLTPQDLADLMAHILTGTRPQ